MHYQSVSAPLLRDMSTPVLLTSIKQYKEETTCNSDTRREHTTLEGGMTTHSVPNVYNEITSQQNKSL